MEWFINDDKVKYSREIPRYARDDKIKNADASKTQTTHPNTSYQAGLSFENISALNLSDPPRGMDKDVHCFP
jgi:hypothetical protein